MSAQKPSTHLSPIRAAWNAHHILLNLITRIMFVEEYRAQNSSLCIILHSTATTPVLGPNIFLSILFSCIVSLRLPQCERPSFTPRQNNCTYERNITCHSFVSSLCSIITVPTVPTKHLVHLCSKQVIAGNWTVRAKPPSELSTATMGHLFSDLYRGKSGGEGGFSLKQPNDESDYSLLFGTKIDYVILWYEECTMCSKLAIYRRFGRTICLQHKGRSVLTMKTECSSEISVSLYTT
jgi:hypothetical protein